MPAQMPEMRRLCRSACARPGETPAFFIGVDNRVVSSHPPVTFGIIFVICLKCLPGA